MTLPCFLHPKLRTVQLFSYLPFLVGIEVIPLKFLAACLGLVLLFLCFDLDQPKRLVREIGDRSIS